MPELSLGKLLRQHRWRAKLTQKELAERIGRTQVWISRVERDKAQPTAEETRLLAVALSLDAAEKAKVIELAGEPKWTMTAGERRAVVERIETQLKLAMDDLARLR
jgi:transcriptional regulator with XRE-family HTH domain